MSVLLLLDMPTKVPDAINSIVIQQWLQGVHRDRIAADNGISAGAVTNIVNEWRAAVSFAKADELRELGTMLRRVGITPGQCALGFRVGMVMNRLGVKEDDFEPFILDLYSRFKDHGLSPEEVAKLLKEMVELTKANAIPLSQISEYIKQKAEEKNKLEGELQNIRTQINALEEEIKESDNRRAFALYEEKMTSAQIKSYSDLMEELKGFGLPIDDLSKFAKVIHGISRMGFDVEKVVNEFSELDSIKKDYWSYREAIPNLQKKYDELKGEYSSLEQTINSHNQTLSVYNELETIGFGLKTLKLLWNTIGEIAFANNIPHDNAVQKFCKDIEEQYDDMLGFESKLKKVREEIDSVTSSLSIARAALLAQPMIGLSLKRLFAEGISEHSIIELANLFERSNDQDKQAFLGGLHKYRILKRGVEILNEEIERLKYEVFALEFAKQNLGEAKHRILLMIRRSKDVVALLQDPLNRTEEEDGNVKILEMIYLFLQNLYVGQGGVEKLIDDGLQKDLPKGPQELKTAVGKGLTIMIDKLENKTREGT